MNRLVLAAAALLLVAAPYAAQAQQPQAEGQQEVEPLSVDRIDPHFVWVAAQTGMAELQLSQLAARQAKSQDVVDFGRTMVEHHGELNQRLIQLAQQLGLQPPQELSPEQLLDLTVLASAAGADFDALYLSGQVRRHEEAVQLYRFIAENGLNEEVRAFAETTLPRLEEHLEVARVLAR